MFVKQPSPIKMDDISLKLKLMKQPKQMRDGEERGKRRSPGEARGA